MIPQSGPKMDLQIRPYETSDLPAIIELSLLAWEPVFVAWEKIFGPELFTLAIYSDWRVDQVKVVGDVIAGPKNITYAGCVGGQVVGFISYELNQETKIGEIQLLAVHPDHQNGGAGTELNLFALQKLREAGMKLAVVGTGGDEGHAPARRSYEKAGYTGLPLVRYYQSLS